MFKNIIKPTSSAIFSDEGSDGYRSDSLNSQEFERVLSPKDESKTMERRTIEAEQRAFEAEEKLNLLQIYLDETKKESEGIIEGMRIHSLNMEKKYNLEYQNCLALKAELDKVNFQFQNRNIQYENLQKMLDEQEDDSEKIKNKLLSTESNMKDMREFTDELIKESRKKNDEIQTVLNKNIEELKAGHTLIERLKRENSVFKIKLVNNDQKHEENVTRLKVKIEELKNAIEILKTSRMEDLLIINDLRIQISNKEAIISNLEIKLNDNSVKNRLESEIETQKNTITQLRAEVENNNSLVARLSSTSQAFEALANEREQKNITLEQQLSNEKQKIVRFSNSVKGFNMPTDRDGIPLAARKNIF